MSTTGGLIIEVNKAVAGLYAWERRDQRAGDPGHLDRSVDPRRALCTIARLRRGIFDLIPLVGATLGAIVVALATVTVSFPLATIVWVAFIIVWQRFEDYVVQPLVYRRALHVNPLVTILAVLAGAELLGVLGALIAIPTSRGHPDRPPRLVVRKRASQGADGLGR